MSGNEELLGAFDVNQTNASQELAARFDVGQGSQDLLARFDGQVSLNLLGEFISRQAGSAELLGETIVRHSDLVELSGEFIVRHSDLEEFLGAFISRQSGFADLLGETVVRHTGAPLPLYSRFAVRLVYPYWTDRRLINGVVAAAEALMGDANLETVIEGVMDDIKVWCDANDVDYVSWINIDTVPTAIKRGTTYGVVAALYARYSKTFQGRVVPTLAPVTVTVVGDDEKAMLHWKDKMREMLELYLSAQEADRIWISTADEEPVFSMDDIPEAGTDRELESWREWLEGQIR